MTALKSVAELQNFTRLTAKNWRGCFPKTYSDTGGKSAQAKSKQLNQVKSKYPMGTAIQRKGSQSNTHKVKARKTNPKGTAQISKVGEIYSISTIHSTQWDIQSKFIQIIPLHGVGQLSSKTCGMPTSHCAVRCSMRKACYQFLIPHSTGRTKH